MSQKIQTSLPLDENQEQVVKAGNKGYVPAKGTENLVHAKLCEGNKFDPNTGERLNVPYIQYFTLGEWNVFKSNHLHLGIKIEEILFNPFDKK